MYDPAKPNDYTPFLAKIEKMSEEEEEDLFSYLNIKDPLMEDYSSKSTFSNEF